MTTMDFIDGEGHIPSTMSLGSSLVGDEAPLTPTEASPIEPAYFQNGTKETILELNEKANPLPAAEVSNLVKLAQLISKETEKLDSYMRKNGLPSPSFDVDSAADFPNLPEDVLKSRQAIIHATSELKELVVGPTESLRWSAWAGNNSLSLHAVYHYKIAQSFPLYSTTTYGDISASTGIPELNIRRLLRHAMTNRIFCEPAPGIIAHTAKSRVLATNHRLGDWVGFCVEDLWPASAATVNSMDLHTDSQEQTHSGFTLANGTDGVEPMFVTMGRDPERAKRFGGAMASLTGGEGYEVSYLVDNYDWGRINDITGTVVDIGGSHGFVCVDLAHKFDKIKFVVEDLPKTVGSAPKLEGDLADRVQFLAHDFHTVQPVKDADVYFFRWILHNQSDKYAENMLRKLIPALKKGARVVINDHCLPEPGQESLWDEKIIRTMDLVMLTLLNSQERTRDDFAAIFARVDPRFTFIGVTRPKGCRMSIVEAIWEGDDYGVAADVPELKVSVPTPTQEILDSTPKESAQGAKVELKSNQSAQEIIESIPEASAQETTPESMLKATTPTASS